MRRLRGQLAPAGRPAPPAAQGKSLIAGACGPGIVQVAQGQKQKVKVAARRGRRRVGAGTASKATTDGRAEFRELFVSLIDPLGLLDMEKCGKIAARMGEVSSRSGYHTGMRMASLLEDIFADAADIVDRPVEDGGMHVTRLAYREARAILYDTAVSYRSGGDGEPVGDLEKLRGRIAAFRAKADALRARLRAADPPGSGLPKSDMRHRGKVCRDVVRKNIETVREWRKAIGDDPVFPPEPKCIDDLFGELGPGLSSVETVSMIRGNCPPDGYELVKIDDAK